MKIGFKTSEFYVGLVQAILVYLNQSQGWNIPVSEILGLTLAVIAYIGSRTYLKGKALSQPTE